jgi:hypothetical protein
MEGARNSAADGLSRTVFLGDCSTADSTTHLLREASRYDNDSSRKWFWKTGEGGYEAYLKDAQAHGTAAANSVATGHEEIMSNIEPHEWV